MNLYFLINSILWFCLYIQYLILNVYSTKDNISDFAYTLDNLCWSLIVTVQLIMFASPLFMIISVFLKLIELVKEKLGEKKK